jgi:glycosyltransferase involved in cell wall biosynthesis
MMVEICLPVKNEEKILAANLQQILDFCQKADFQFSWKIIGIINGSTDKTASIFLDFKKRYPELVDYVEFSVAGRGRVLKKYWQESGADILSYLDIDLAVLPDQLPALIQPIIDGEADLVIGSRLLADSKTRRSYLRETTSRFFNFLTHVFLPNKASDLQCGFKAVRADIFKKIAPFIRDNYWFFDSELVVLSQYFSYRLKEVPVDWAENRYEKRTSKVKVIRDIVKSLKDLLVFRWRLFFISKN